MEGPDADGLAVVRQRMVLQAGRPQDVVEAREDHLEAAVGPVHEPFEGRDPAEAVALLLPVLGIRLQEAIGLVQEQEDPPLAVALQPFLHGAQELALAHEGRVRPHHPVFAQSLGEQDPDVVQGPVVAQSLGLQVDPDGDAPRPFPVELVLDLAEEHRLAQLPSAVDEARPVGIDDLLGLEAAPVEHLGRHLARGGRVELDEREGQGGLEQRLQPGGLLAQVQQQQVVDHEERASTLRVAAVASQFAPLCLGEDAEVEDQGTRRMRRVSHAHDQLLGRGLIPGAQHAPVPLRQGSEPGDGAHFPIHDAFRMELDPLALGHLTDGEVDRVEAQVREDGCGCLHVDIPLASHLEPQCQQFGRLLRVRDFLAQVLQPDVGVAEPQDEATGQLVLDLHDVADVLLPFGFAEEAHGDSGLNGPPCVRDVSHEGVSAFVDAPASLLPELFGRHARFRIVLQDLDDALGRLVVAVLALELERLRPGPSPAGHEIEERRQGMLGLPGVVELDVAELQVVGAQVVLDGTLDGGPGRARLEESQDAVHSAPARRHGGFRAQGGAAQCAVVEFPQHGFASISELLAELLGARLGKGLGPAGADPLEADPTAHQADGLANVGSHLAHGAVVDVVTELAPQDRTVRVGDLVIETRVVVEPAELVEELLGGGAIVVPQGLEQSVHELSGLLPVAPDLGSRVGGNVLEGCPRCPAVHVLEKGVLLLLPLRLVHDLLEGRGVEGDAAIGVARHVQDEEVQLLQVAQPKGVEHGRGG